MSKVNYTPRACEVLEEVQGLMKQKTKDYTSNVIGDDAYFPDGYEIAPNAVLMHTKLVRYVASVAGGEDNTPEECLHDLIAYAARAIARLEDINEDPRVAENEALDGPYLAEDGWEDNERNHWR